jgi:hypothetical protein
LLHKIDPTARRSGFAEKTARTASIFAIPPLNGLEIMPWLRDEVLANLLTIQARTDLLFTMSENTRHTLEKPTAPEGAAMP